MQPRSSAPKKPTPKRTAVPQAKQLGAKARKFRDAVLGVYELSVSEQRTLEDACREIDLIERLQGELDNADLIVRGSMGQPVASPFVQEIRQHRAILDRLLKSLNLPAEDVGAAIGDRSASARERAMRRWGAGGT